MVLLLTVGAVQVLLFLRVQVLATEFTPVLQMEYTLLQYQSKIPVAVVVEVNRMLQASLIITSS